MITKRIPMLIQRRRLLRLSLAMCSLSATVMLAQDPAQPVSAPVATSAPPQAAAETERIIVTGSNIPTAQEVGPNPVLNINRDLINKSVRAHRGRVNQKSSGRQRWWRSSCQ